MPINMSHRVFRQGGHGWISHQLTPPSLGRFGGCLGFDVSKKDQRARWVWYLQLHSEQCHHFPFAAESGSVPSASISLKRFLMPTSISSQDVLTGTSALNHCAA